MYHSDVGCNEHQKTADKNRGDRGRNYKNENFRNPQRYYGEYVRGASKRAYDMMLTFEEFYALIVQPCYYCDYKVEDEVNGIDRYDNTKGYTVDNSVPCCKWCNRMKLDQPTDEFLERCNKIAKNMKRILSCPPEVIPYSAPPRPTL